MFGKPILGALAVFAVGIAPLTARAEEARTYGLSIAVAQKDGAPVRDDRWIDAQIADANRLFAPSSVSFRWTHQKALPSAHTELHSREDRDVLTRRTEGGVIDVFVVAELEDVDEPGRLRMGVCWTSRLDKKRYVALASSAMPTVLAHELGHFFGNPHSLVVDNVMSYSRTGATAFFDDAQLATIRTFSRRFFETKRLFDVGPPRMLW